MFKPVNINFSIVVSKAKTRKERCTSGRKDNLIQTTSFSSNWMRTIDMESKTSRKTIEQKNNIFCKRPISISAIHCLDVVMMKEALFCSLQKIIAYHFKATDFYKPTKYCSKRAFGDLYLNKKIEHLHSTSKIFTLNNISIVCSVSAKTVHFLHDKIIS